MIHTLLRQVNHWQHPSQNPATLADCNKINNILQSEEVTTRDIRVYDVGRNRFGVNAATGTTPVNREDCIARNIKHCAKIEIDPMKPNQINVFLQEVAVVSHPDITPEPQRICQILKKKTGWSFRIETGDKGLYLATNRPGLIFPKNKSPANRLEIFEIAIEAAVLVKLAEKIFGKK